MAVSSKTFTVGVDSDSAHLVFGIRAAAADFVRGYFRTKIEGAEDAGIDRMTAMQKGAITFAKAAKGSRLVRAIPPALVKWAGYVEYNARHHWFPAVEAQTIGTFDRDNISAMPGDVKVVKLGGLIFIGSFSGDIPTDIVEIRVTKVGGTYLCTIVHGRPDDGSDVALPEPVEPEGVDA